MSEDFGTQPIEEDDDEAEGVDDHDRPLDDEDEEGQIGGVGGSEETGTELEDQGV